MQWSSKLKSPGAIRVRGSFLPAILRIAFSIFFISAVASPNSPAGEIRVARRSASEENRLAVAGNGKISSCRYNCVDDAL
jgi:hypothetical protein